MKNKIRVLVWNEFIKERTNPEAAKVYPDGIHCAIAKFLQNRSDFEVRTATFDEPEHGLTDDALNNTDVLIWWGHKVHEKVSDTVVDKVYHRITDEGMGLIVLHSAHNSKIFKRLLGTSCSLKWRNVGEKERLWVIAPGHPIAENIMDYFEIEHTEMYGEPFDIPIPDELVFISWFKGGEVFRSGCCFYRGQGKIFYFRPGHETYPVFYDPNVLKVIDNSIHWAIPVKRPKPVRGQSKPLEELP